jgi:hypothetical protein
VQGKNSRPLERAMIFGLDDNSDGKGTSMTSRELCSHNRGARQHTAGANEVRAGARAARRGLRLGARRKNGMPA